MKRQRVRLAVSALSLLAWFAAPVAAGAQQGPRDYGPHMGYGGHMWEGGWSGWFIGPLMMILFFFAAVIVIVLVVRWLGGTEHRATPHAPPGNTPLDILKERFARGEIEKEDFEERRRLLE